jgi:hypothetical protein
MSPPLLPDGSEAWFVRRKTRGGWKVQPCSIQGWTVTIAFVVVNILFAAALGFFEVGDSPPLMVGAITFFVVAAILFMTFTFRMSVREP